MKPLRETVVELRRLEKEATPGPWRHDNDAKGTEGDPCLFTERGPSFCPGKSPIFTAPAFWTAADGDLCAAARNSLGQLLDAADENERLRSLLGEALAAFKRGHWLVDIEDRIEAELGTQSGEASK
jgi:hypothetical protein